VSNSSIKYSTNQLRDYSSIFSRRQSLSIIDGNLEGLESKIDRYDQSWRAKKSATYLEYIKHAYKVISTHYKNEYVYKNTLLNALIIKELGTENSKVFSEFRVGDSIADLAMFNGCSKVFEIKSDLDTPQRLETQLKDYHKVFNEVYLVVPQSKLKDFRHIDSEVGIIAVKKDNTIELVREAHYKDTIEAATLMTVLRTSEYRSMAKAYTEDLPKMSSFTQFDICSKILKEIPCDILNDLFITEMKKRKSNESFSATQFKELNQLFLALNLTKKGKSHFIANLNKPIRKLCTTHTLERANLS